MTRIDLLSNPMTTDEDIIKAGASGVPERLAVGSNGDVLTVTAGAVGWTAPAGGAEGWETVVADLSGKVHRWKFEESSGDFNDEISTLDLIANGSISYSVSTPLGNGVSFTGGFAESSGLGSIPTGDNPRTVLVVWKKTAEGTVSNPLPIFGYGAGSTRQLFQLFGTAYATLRFGLLNNQLDASTPVGDGGWHVSAFGHIAATRQFGTGYYDGRMEIFAEGGNLATSSANNFHIAAEFDDTDPAAITVADAIVFDRWVSKPELDRLYQAFQRAM